VLIGHERFLIHGIFLATTGEAFARNAGKKMRNNDIKLSTCIMRYEKYKRE
jgi:hypothetical protein